MMTNSAISTPSTTGGPRCASMRGGVLYGLHAAFVAMSRVDVQRISSDDV